MKKESDEREGVLNDRRQRSDPIGGEALIECLGVCVMCDVRLGAVGYVCVV